MHRWYSMVPLVSLFGDTGNLTCKQALSSEIMHLSDSNPIWGCPPLLLWGLDNCDNRWLCAPMFHWGEKYTTPQSLWNWNEYNLIPLTKFHWSASLVPAALWSPAPITDQVWVVIIRRDGWGHSHYAAWVATDENKSICLDLTIRFNISILIQQIDIIFRFSV